MTQFPATPESRWSTAKLRRDLILLVVLALACRLTALGTLDPWEDEVYSYIGSGDLLHKQLMWTGERMTLHSPLPYIEIKVARAVFGPGAFSLRLPAACYGTLAVAALYLLLRRLFNRPVALSAAIILAVHPLALEWSRDARMYSHWLATSAIMMLLAHEAVRYAREDPAPTALNWRWWTLGLIFNWAHSSALFAVTTIAAVGLWIGLIALATLPGRFRSGLTMLLGAALSTGVYLTGWSLNGIGRLLFRTSGGGPPPEGADHMNSELPRAVATVTRALAGEVPMMLAVALLALAADGLIVLLVRRQFAAFLLLVLVAFTPWLAYPSIAKQHFFAPRYVIVELLTITAGWGVVIAMALVAVRAKSRAVHIALIGGLAAVAVGLWFPAWRNLYTVPKIPYSRALAPIVEHATSGEALIPVPEWYVQLGRFYDFPDDLTLVSPPIEARLFTGVSGELESIDQLGYEADFNDTFNTATPQTRPPATWLLIVSPSPDRIETIAPLLRAYGLDPATTLDDLAQAGQHSDTLTCRVTDVGIDHITTTRGRSDQWWWSPSDTQR